MSRKAATESHPRWMQAALERIAEQSAFVGRLKPATEDHKRAVGVLLVLQDSLLHSMSEAHDLLERLRGSASR